MGGIGAPAKVSGKRVGTGRRVVIAVSVIVQRDVTDRRVVGPGRKCKKRVGSLSRVVIRLPAIRRGNHGVRDRHEDKAGEGEKGNYC